MPVEYYKVERFLKNYLHNNPKPKH